MLISSLLYVSGKGVNSMMPVSLMGLILAASTTMFFLRTWLRERLQAKEKTMTKEQVKEKSRLIWIILIFTMVAILTIFYFTLDGLSKIIPCPRPELHWKMM